MNVKRDKEKLVSFLKNINPQSYLAVKNMSIFEKSKSNLYIIICEKEFFKYVSVKYRLRIKTLVAQNYI